MRLMECGLLLLFFFFERRLGLSWRNPNVGIAIGLGITASVDLMCSYMQSRFPAQAFQLGMVNTAAYVGVLTFWCYVLLADRLEKKSAVSPPRGLILQRWNEALTATPLVTARQQAAAFSSVESFLPGVERTVERVMARKMH